MVEVETFDKHGLGQPLIAVKKSTASVYRKSKTILSDSMRGMQVLHGKINCKEDIAIYT